MQRLMMALVLLLVLPGSLLAQGRGAPPPRDVSAQSSVSPYPPGLVEAIDPWGDHPTLRFRIGHEHKALLMIDYCYGDLYVSADSVRLEVMGPYSGHSFDLPRAQVTGIKPWSFGVEMVVKGRKYHAFAYPLGGGNPQTGILLMPQLDTGYTNPKPVMEALTDFPTALERARAALPRPAPPPEPPKPPSLLLLEPAGADTNAIETSAEKITVRGVSLDSKGTSLVLVGTKVAAMQPRSPQAMEFWAEELPLQLGENELEIVAINVEGLEAKMVLKLRRVEAAPPEPPPPTGLSLEETLKLLDAGVTPARVITLVKDRGVSFSLNDETEKKLRDAGANDALLLEIAKAKK